MPPLRWMMSASMPPSFLIVKTARPSVQPFFPWDKLPDSPDLMALRFLLDLLPMSPCWLPCAATVATYATTAPSTCSGGCA
jgi:hypothetical protein